MINIRCCSKHVNMCMYMFSPVQPTVQLQATSLNLAVAFSPSRGSPNIQSPLPEQLHRLTVTSADGAIAPFSSTALNLKYQNISELVGHISLLHTSPSFDNKNLLLKNLFVRKDLMFYQSHFPLSLQTKDCSSESVLTKC